MPRRWENSDSGREGSRKTRDRCGDSNPIESTIVAQSSDECLQPLVAEVHCDYRNLQRNTRQDTIAVDICFGE